MSRGLIVLDPGHGPTGNRFTILTDFYEGTQMWHLSQFLRDELIARGFDVMLTRPNLEDNPSLAERGEMAGKHGAIMFLSLHSNAPGMMKDPEAYAAVNGAETFYSVTDPARNIPIAEALTAAAVSTMQTGCRGIKTRLYPDRPDLDYYGVIRAAATSGCPQAFLIEQGFHTNPHDSAFLADLDCLRQLAKAEAEAISACFA